MSHCYQYPRPAVTTDIIVYNKASKTILLIKRKNDPFKDQWAIPGGFVDDNEPLIDAAKRELLEETALQNIELKQFAAYGDPNRDPRGHCVSIVYYHINNESIALTAKAGDDAKEVKWFNLDNLPALAFDHLKIITDFSTHLNKQ